MSDAFSTLPPELAAMARRTVAAREVDGRNVHFVNESGRVDRYSFDTIERADAFRANLQRHGRIMLDTQEQAAAAYVDLIGYDPFTDDPTMTVEQVRQILSDYLEERR